MRRELAFAASLALLLGACGEGRDEKTGLTAKERAQLDNAAAMQDQAQTIDTSPDSLVLNESATDEASANLQGQAVPANGSSTTMNGMAVSNSSGQR